MDQGKRKIWVVRATALTLAAAAGAGMTYHVPESVVPLAPVVALLVWSGLLYATGTALRRWEPYPSAMPETPAAKANRTESQVLVIRVAGATVALLAAVSVACFGPENIRALGGLVGILLIQAIFYGAGVPLARWENPYTSSDTLGDALRNTSHGPNGVQ